MKSLRNKVVLTGNLGADPEIKTLESEKTIANFSLAVNESFTNKEGEKITNTDWFSITAWNGIAKKVAKLLKKGSYVIVEGKLHNDSYEDKNGIKKHTTYVVINDFFLLDKKENSEISEEE